MPPTALSVQKQLRQKGNPKLANAQLSFYQTQLGGYGEGDKFLGIRVPESRKIAQQYSTLPIPQILKLAASKFHEERFVALVILLLQFKKATTKQEQKVLFDVYLKLVKSGKVVNNWDLVDATAPIFGTYLIADTKADKFLLELLKSKSMWVQRVAMLMTFAFIRDGDNRLTLILAEKLLNHPHDLMHKASGWMLREAGKRNIRDLREFLGNHSRNMPRTMLRYSIEKLPERERHKWMTTKP
jgi:3-methyladenine DNA glycosylase AlkD